MATRRDELELMHEAGYISAAEAAVAICRKNVSSIHRMVQRGDVGGTRVGVHWYVSVSDLLKRFNGPGVGEHLRNQLSELGVTAAE